MGCGMEMVEEQCERKWRGGKEKRKKKRGEAVKIKGEMERVVGQKGDLRMATQRNRKEKGEKLKQLIPFPLNVYFTFTLNSTFLFPNFSLLIFQSQFPNYCCDLIVYQKSL